MSTLIVAVSPDHKLPAAPVAYNLGAHSNLIITSENAAPDAFELVSTSDGEPKQETILLDNQETCNLYQCLHTLLFADKKGSEA